MKIFTFCKDANLRVFGERDWGTHKSDCGRVYVVFGVCIVHCSCCSCRLLHLQHEQWTMDKKSTENEKDSVSFASVYITNKGSDDPDRSNESKGNEKEKIASPAASAMHDAPQPCSDPSNDLISTIAKSLHISEDERTPILLCDMGYGLPREERPRKERLNAIAKQLVNFLSWQESVPNTPKATVKVVACPDPDALLSRLLELWSGDSSLPNHVSISNNPLDAFVQEKAVYLSPDAPDVLDPHAPPPRVVIVGMLIDRRVQPNRSRQRAEKMDVQAARWPALVGWDPQEPFNVDCILEGMQQWHWNHDAGSGTFLEAARQALRHHQERHPQRVQHIPISKG